MNIKISAREIAGLIQGQIEGNPEVEISSFSKIEGAQSGSISFLSNPAYEQHIYNTNASVVIVSTDFKPSAPVKSTLIRVDNPYSAVAQLLEKFNSKPSIDKGVHPLAFIDSHVEYDESVSIGAFSYIGKNVKIGKNTIIYPHTYIGDNCIIGSDSVIYPGVIIYFACKIGNNCTVHSGCIIGSDGFGFAPTDTKNYKKVPQTGNVVLEDYVEIGANTTIDRATLGSTIIGKGVKLDNLIQIAHNVEIGQNTVIAAQTGISGSTHIGKDCMIGGQVGIVGHIQIADGVKIAAQSGVGSTEKESGTILQGSPAFDISKYRRSYVAFRSLPDIINRINELENKIKELESK